MRQVIFVVLFLACAIGAQAQTGMRFGFHASPSFSWLAANTSEVNANGTNLGLRLGMLGEYYFQDNYAVTSGIGFAFNTGGTQQRVYGGEYWTRSNLGTSLDTLNDGVNLKYSLQFLEIPVGMKMKTNEIGHMTYFMQPQLVLGIKTQATGYIDDPVLQNENEEKLNIRKEVNGLGLSWGIGAGAEYNFAGNSSLLFGIEFQSGFTDVTDDNGTVFDPDGNHKADEKTTQKMLTIRIGVLF